MDQSTQYSFAPLLRMLLAEVDEELEHARAESARAASESGRVAASTHAAAAPPLRLMATPSALQAERARLVHALHRVEEGNYGRCFRCGRDIPTERLTNQPHALTCSPGRFAPGSQK